jgi:hypothetical protein
MEEPIANFSPQLGDQHAQLLIGAILALLALAGATALLRRPGRREVYRRRTLSAMLLFFVFLLAAGTVGFSWLTMRKIGPVRIYADAVRTPYGLAVFENIRNAAIQTEQDRSRVNPTFVRKEYRFLVIEEYSGKTHVLSEENFDLPQVLNALRQAVETWRENQAGDAGQK